RQPPLLMVERENRKLVAAFHQAAHELLDRVTGLLNATAVHAVAHVEQHTQAHWHTFVGKLRDRLQCSVFKHIEGLARQSGDEHAVLVKDGRRHSREVDGGLEDWELWRAL